MDISPTKKGINLAADAHFLPFRDKIIGNTLCKSVLEHVQSPIKALLEMKRVTIDKIIISVPNVMEIKRILRTLRNPLYNIPLATRHLQGWDSKEIRHLAYLTGLTVQSITWEVQSSLRWRRLCRLLFSSHMIVTLHDSQTSFLGRMR